MWPSTHHLIRTLGRTPLILKLACIAPLLLLAGSLVPPLAQAESPTLVSLKFPDSQGDAPRRTAGAGVRGGPVCITNHPEQTLVALVPNDLVSLTLTGQPTFFVYIPTNKAPEAVFELSLNPDQNGSYTQRITLSGDAGLVEVNLPPEVSITPGQEYFWRFSLVCDPKSPESNAVVQGKVKRTELTASQMAELAKLTPGSMAEAEFYASHRIWHEATDVLYGLRTQAPQQWSEWLGSVNLGFLGSQPAALNGSPVLF